MKRKLLLLAAFVASALGMRAQTDVTSTYIVNPGFESSTPRTSNLGGGNNSTTGDDYSSTGWEIQTRSTWCSSAVVSYGGAGMVNGTAAPSSDNAGNSGNTLGVSVGWSGTQVYQSKTAVTLPAGTYRLEYYAYNNNTTNSKVNDINPPFTRFTSKVGFVPTSGTAQLSTKSHWAVGHWDKDVVYIILDADTEGKFQVGGTAVNGGSGANAKLFFDNFKLYRCNDVNAASDENPVDVTYKVTNINFDENITGWTTTTGAQNQNIATNKLDAFNIPSYENWNGTAFTGKVSQTINNLARGKYSLGISAFVGAVGNSGTQYVYGNNATTNITSITPTAYAVDNILVNRDGTLEIGLELKEGGSTQWIGIDNISLTYFGPVLEMEQDLWQTAYNNATTACNSNLYVNVVGTERTALETSLSTYGTMPTTVEDCRTALEDLETKTNTFVAAKTTYDALVSEIAHAKDLGVETATADGFAATSTSTVESINSTNLPGLNVAEYSAVNTNYTETVTLNSWTEDFNEDLNGEGYVADGVKYWNEWGSATRTGKQTLTLPAGDYAVTCIGRGNVGTSGYLYYKIGDASAVTTNFNMKGNRGKGVDTSGAANFSDGGTYNCNNEGFGWEYRYLNFHLDAEASVEIGVSATFASNWVSIYAPKVLTTLASVKNVALTQITAALATVPADDMNATVKSTLDSKVAAAEAASMSNTKEELATILSELNDAITAANSSVAEYNKIKDYLTTSSTNVDGDYSSISAAITAGIYENSVDGMVAVKALRNTIATTSMAAGKDLTGLIDNNSFETGNTNFWTTTASSDTGARSTTGDYAMSNSDGSYLFNTWWKGTPITQNIGTLPAGAYELKGVVASDGGTIYITMNDKHEAYVETVDAKAVGIEFSYVFTLDAAQEVTIGVVGGDDGTKGAHKAYKADGYWFYKADNFRLKYLGATAPENTIDGTYYLSIGENYLSRGGDSGTEAAMKAEANRLPVQIVTDKAGVSTIQMIDTRNYLLYSTSEVYTDGTIPTPAKTHHKPYWKITAVTGGYQILNTESGKYLTTLEVDRDGETLVATCSDTPSTWTFTDFAALDYSTLESEIASAETHVIGFEAGEHAPYNNIAAMEKLAQAKDLFNNQKAITQEQITNMVTSLSSTTWTANVEEVNAIYDGTFAAATNNGAPAGWSLTGATNSGDSNNTIGGAYRPRAFVLTSSDGNYAKLASFGQGDGTRSAFYVRFDSRTAKNAVFTYGANDGYTIPLKANTVYRLTAQAGGWGHTKDFVMSVVNDNDESIASQKITLENVDAGGSAKDYNMCFVVPANGNYKLQLTNGVNDNNAAVVSNIELKRADITIDENSDYSPIAGVTKSVTLTRTIKAGYNTLVLPFDLTQAEVEAKFGAGSAVYTVDDSQSTSSSIYFATNDGITANSPVLLKATAAGTSYDFNNVTIKSGTPTLAGTNVSFIGSYAASTDIAKDANNYIISGGKLYLVDSDGIFVKGTRAYFNVPSASAAKMIGVSFEDGETTSIEELMNSNGNILKGEVYDLQGRRVATPTRGLYIIGGKKVFIK